MPATQNTAGPWKDGTHVVFTDATEFPDRCRRCNRPAHEADYVILVRHAPVFGGTSGGWRFGLLAPLLTYIQELAHRDEARIAIPVCNACRPRITPRGLGRILGVLGILLALGALLLLWLDLVRDVVMGSMFIASFGAFIAAFVASAWRYDIHVARYEAPYYWTIGFAPQYRNECPPFPSTTSPRPAPSSPPKTSPRPTGPAPAARSKGKDLGK